VSSQVVIVNSRIAKDPEIKQVGETTIANFSLPVEYRKKGEKYTQWFNCVAFNKTASLIEQYFPKGKPITVTGELQTEEYEGKKYSKLIVRTVAFIDKDLAVDTGGGDEDETEEEEEVQPRRAAKPAARAAAKPAARRAAPTEDSEELPWE
jgi:single-strand DNA-binding protein